MIKKIAEWLDDIMMRVIAFFVFVPIFWGLWLLFGLVKFSIKGISLETDDDFWEEKEE